MTVEFNVDGSLSDGVALDVAAAEIEIIKEVSIIPDGADEVQLYVNQPKILSKTIERR